MKIRNGFVSNSSSSSFLLFKIYMTEEQIKYIRNWEKFAVSKTYQKILDEYAKTHEIEEHYLKDYDDNECPAFSEIDFPYYPEGWSVQETKSTFEIGTSMDNFNMEQFLAVIGVDIDKMGLRLEDHHCAVLGLNDARADIKDYVSDPYYFDHYDDEYWLTSNYYRDKIYPIEQRLQAKNPELASSIAEPKEKKIWVCEDAGKALNEVEHSLKELALKNEAFYLEKLPNGQYYDEKCRLYAEVLDTVNEVKDNWKTRDDFEETT